MERESGWGRVLAGEGARSSEVALLPETPVRARPGARRDGPPVVPGASAVLSVAPSVDSCPELRAPLTGSCDSGQVAQPPCRPVSSSEKGDVSNSTGCLPSCLLSRQGVERRLRSSLRATFSGSPAPTATVPAGLGTRWGQCRWATGAACLDCPRLGLSLPLCALCCPSPRRTPAAGRGGLGRLPVCSGGPAPPGSLSTLAVGRAGPRCLLGLRVAPALQGTRPPGQSRMTLGALRTGEERGRGTPARLGQKSLSLLPGADTPSAASEPVFRRPTWVPSYPPCPLQAQPGPSPGGPCPCSGCLRWLSGSHPLLLRISTQPHPGPPLPCPAPLSTLLQPGAGL